MDPSLMEYIAGQIEEIKGGSGWGEVTIVVERREITCVKVTDSRVTASICNGKEPKVTFR